MSTEEPQVLDTIGEDTTDKTNGVDENNEVPIQTDTKVETTIPKDDYVNPTEEEAPAGDNAKDDSESEMAKEIVAAVEAANASREEAENRESASAEAEEASENTTVNGETKKTEEASENEGESTQAETEVVSENTTVNDETKEPEADANELEEVPTTESEKEADDSTIEKEENREDVESKIEITESEVKTDVAETQEATLGETTVTQSTMVVETVITSQKIVYEQCENTDPVEEAVPGTMESITNEDGKEDEKTTEEKPDETENKEQQPQVNGEEKKDEVVVEPEKTEDDVPSEEKSNVDVITEEAEGEKKTPKTGNDSTPECKGPKTEASQTDIITEENIEVTPEDIETLKNNLKVKNLNIRSYSNQKAHRTDEYDVPNVLLRRGQLFEIVVAFEQQVKLNEHEIHVVISLGESPKVTDDTKISVPIGKTAKHWKVDLLSIKDDEVSLRIHSPADAPVGKLNIGLSAMLKPIQDPMYWRYVDLFTHDEHLYLLFNPWCKDDTVYIEGEEARQEYILNDAGVLYEGSHGNPKPRPWNFGQFDTFVTLAAFHLLEKGLPINARSSAVKVARVMSAMVNSHDNAGVLIGNWSGEYGNGKAPSEWAGSVEVLSQYMTTGEPVGYAQCWVFSGVLTSVLRCLGIPTRSVTVYSSAQDTDGSMTVDVHWNQRYEPFAEYNTDNVWVFHVFNECYMARPDIHKGKKYRGWQVIDGTPAQRSDGLYQTGPSPISAIKRGNVPAKFDTEYAFAMVNADRVHWMIQESDGNVFSKRILHKETSSIGKKIVTKSIGSDNMDNITQLYKYHEGSKEERRAVNTACSHGTVHKKYFETLKPKDFDMKVQIDENVKLGADVNMKVVFHNKTDSEQKIELFIECYGTQYTGSLKGICRKEKFEVTVPPGHKAKGKGGMAGHKERLVSGMVNAVGSLRRSSTPVSAESSGVADVAMTLYYEDYKTFIQDHTALKFFIIAVRKDHHRHEIALQDELILSTPSLKMTVSDPSKLKRDEDFTVDISFTNPLPVTLTNVRFNLEGLRFQQAKTIQYGDIAPEADVHVNFNLTPKLAGKKILVATLHSNQLQGVNGALQVEIRL
ncbi:protein-glutamine gamma-glutamyltransferase K-like [Saccoglossus kowalevskii]|uniref:Protein-glutamine gamma-glutamyltransferase K-like n=1 Tax=Saccoglossus kowalevskii TaxID=10224 RepID=A0ABM0GVJ9_SACKO|nr:PREDICTED: protein-glutamine gamma-glutamyltransferase K-like [Saccoglossus kowalevskii]